MRSLPAGLVCLLALALPATAAAQQSIEGVLGPGYTPERGGRYYQIYEIGFAPGVTSASFRLSSAAFDAILYVAAGYGPVYADDDGAGDRNALITVADARAGAPWYAIATTYAPGQTGAFVLESDGATFRAIHDPAEWQAVRMMLGDLPPEGPPSGGPPSSGAGAPPPQPAPMPQPAPQPQPQPPPGPPPGMPPPAPNGGVPSFPWPPPQASGTARIAVSQLVDRYGALATMGDVDAALTDVLDATGYVERSYYAVPRGFAIVTRLEQTAEDGTPLSGPGRWAMQPVSTEEFSVLGYVRALFMAEPGYFRVIVFAVTPQPFVQDEEGVAREEAMAWLGAGLNALPESIAALAADSRLRVTALVYEFELPNAGEDPEFAVPGRMTGQDHLARAGILGYLRR